jgi:predicted  nucleic acid-binding Zn-ribbon protein
MSEARFDRLESQLTQVIQAIGTMQQNMATKQDLAVLEQKVVGIEQKVVGIEQKVVGIEQKVVGIEQNVNAIREDIFNLRNRIDSVEGAVSVVIRGTFVAHQSFVDDLNFDLLKNERKTRRLSRRVARLERQELDDD